MVKMAMKDGGRVDSSARISVEKSVEKSVDHHHLYGLGGGAAFSAESSLHDGESSGHPTGSYHHLRPLPTQFQPRNLGHASLMVQSQADEGEKEKLSAQRPAGVCGEGTP